MIPGRLKAGDREIPLEGSTGHVHVYGDGEKFALGFGVGSVTFTHMDAQTARLLHSLLDTVLRREKGDSAS